MENVRMVLMQTIKDLDIMRARLQGLLLDSGASVLVPRQGSWTQQEVIDLWNRVSHLAGIRALFEVTSERAGESVAFSEVLERSGLTERQQRNEHARMSRLAAELFGEKRWPIENWQGPPQTTTGREEMLYRMHPDIAAWWRGHTS